MPAHKIDYRIIGHELQMLEIALGPGEAVIAEAGTMVYLERDIHFETKIGESAEHGMMGKLLGAGKRLITGEPVFVSHFINHGAGLSRAAFAAPYPGNVIAVDLAEVGGEFICQKDAFLAAAADTHVEIALHKRLAGGFFGGEGFILQRLRGAGMTFIHAGGALIQKLLQDEVLTLHAGCLVGFCGDISYDVQLSGGLKSMFFGGEGVFLATLQGSGTVWIQSMPFSRLTERVFAHAHAHHSDEK